MTDQICSYRGCGKPAIGFMATPNEGLMVCEYHAPKGRDGKVREPYNERRGRWRESYRPLGQPLPPEVVVE
jgi:hypothetical protein